MRKMKKPKKTKKQKDAEKKARSERSKQNRANVDRTQYMRVDDQPDLEDRSIWGTDQITWPNVRPHPPKEWKDLLGGLRKRLKTHLLGIAVGIAVTRLSSNGDRNFMSDAARLAQLNARVVLHEMEGGRMSLERLIARFDPCETGLDLETEDGRLLFAVRCEAILERAEKMTKKTYDSTRAFRLRRSFELRELGVGGAQVDSEDPDQGYFLQGS